MKLDLQTFAADRPLQGFDVSVTLTGPNGPALVGEFQELTLDISNEIEEYMTLNSRMPLLLDGEIKLSGTLKRGFIDVGAAVKAAFGSSSLKPTLKFSSPRYVITASFDSTEKGIKGRYELKGSIIDKLSLNSTQGKATVKSDYTFRSETMEEI